MKWKYSLCESGGIKYKILRHVILQKISAVLPRKHTASLQSAAYASHGSEQQLASRESPWDHL